MTNLNTLRVQIAAALTLAVMEARPTCSVQAVNRTDVPVHLSLVLQNGDFVEARPYITLLPGDSCELMENFRGSWFGWYAWFGNEERTDIQYQGPYAEQYRYEPATGTRTLTASIRRGHTTRCYTPVFLASSDSVRLLEFEEVSTCRGRCYNGAGTEYTFGEYFTTSWRDGQPYGPGILVSADTTYEGAWRGEMHGHFLITATDGYREEGRFVDGLREGGFTVRLPNNDRLSYNYEKGVLHGKQEAVIERPGGYGRERRTLCYEHGVEVSCPVRAKGAGMYRASPIIR